MKKIVLATIMLTCAAASQAQGFVPCGGFADSTEAVLDAVASGYAANESTLLTHGLLAGGATATSGIEAIESGAAVIVSLSADGNVLTVQCPGTARADIYAIDGRTVLSANCGTEGAISLSALVPGHYIVRVSTASAAPFVKRFIKR